MQALSTKAPNTRYTRRISTQGHPQARLEPRSEALTPSTDCILIRAHTHTHTHCLLTSVLCAVLYCICNRIIQFSWIRSRLGIPTGMNLREALKGLLKRLILLFRPNSTLFPYAYEHAGLCPGHFAESETPMVLVLGEKVQKNKTRAKTH